MKTGKITAKLRDAVVIRLFEEGEERKQYKNIELPDALKELKMKDFEFDVPMDGKITFVIHYEPGALPEVFPEPRSKMTRTEKAAAKAAAVEAQAESPEEPADMEIMFNITGERWKELVTAAASIIGMEPVYQAAPSFAYAIGEYTIDKNGTLRGKMNQQLTDALAEQGFIAAESTEE
jgi:hypothetical protein